MLPSKKILAALVGAAAVACGCGPTDAEEVGAGDQAHTERGKDDDDDFVVEDRMGRPEMTNVTIGAGLVRLKVLKARLAAVQKQAAAEADATRRAALEAEAAKVGAELKRLGAELGAPEAEALKAELAKDAVTDASEQKAIDEAVKAGRVPPTFPRRVSGWFRGYNHQITFHPLPGEQSDAKRMLAAGIRALDTLSLDGATPDPVDWSEDEVSKVADLLTEDALIVDIGKPCTHDTQSYFAIEREAFQSAEEKARSAPSCGGRTLNDDIIDDTLTMWIKKSFDFEASSPLRVGDAVVAVTEPGAAGPFALSPAIKAFPYLGEPRPSPFVGAGACSGSCRAPSNQEPSR